MGGSVDFNGLRDNATWRLTGGYDNGYEYEYMWIQVFARPQRARLTYLRLAYCRVFACKRERVCLFIGRLESTNWKQSNNTRSLN